MSVCTKIQLFVKKHLKHPVFNIISDIAAIENLEVYVIGGFVRDLLLQRKSKDIDIVVIGSGIQLAEKVNSKINGPGKLSIFKNFGTAMIQFDDWEIEFVGARKESYLRNSRKPIVEDGTLQDDQFRRDFTINAMAIGLSGENYGKLLDPFGGMDDLTQGIIKTPLDPELTFSDDPLRMMRAIRFACQLGFTIEEKTFRAIDRQKERIHIISGERIVDELNKVILSETPSFGFELLDKSGLLPLIFPEFSKLKGVQVQEGKGHKDNFYHTLQVLDNLSRHSDDLWLRWSALLHDIAKPATKKFSENGWTFHGHDAIGAAMVPTIFKRLKLPLNQKMKFVQKMVALHLRPIVLAEDIVTDSAIRRLLIDAGDDIDALMTLCEADITSKIDAKVKKYLANFKLVRQKLKEVEDKDKVRNFQPPVDGELIIKTFQIVPSKVVGDIKQCIKDAILDGKIGNNFDEAYSFMLETGLKLGLKRR
jgi:poly(A) polymerase